MPTSACGLRGGYNGRRRTLHRGHDQAVADGPTLCPRRFHRIAMERVPEPRTGHAAPGRAKLERVHLPQVFYGREVPSRQPHSASVWPSLASPQDRA